MVILIVTLVVPALSILSSSTLARYLHGSFHAAHQTWQKQSDKSKQPLLSLLDLLLPGGLSLFFPVLLSSFTPLSLQEKFLLPSTSGQFFTRFIYCNPISHPCLIVSLGYKPCKARSVAFHVGSVPSSGILGTAKIQIFSNNNRLILNAPWSCLPPFLSCL